MLPILLENVLLNYKERSDNMKVFVTYIRKETVVPEQRATIAELLMQSVGYEQEYQNYSKGFFEVRTLETEPLPFNVGRLVETLGTPYTKEYIQFRIPKSSGGTRLIKAPVDELKELQKNIANMIQNNYRVLPHNAAYAYMRGRCAYDALVTHQRNNARWFLKLDIKDFFPSITKEVLMNKLPFIYPLNELSEDEMEQLIDIATDEGSLPQGSPLSPLLSNLVMLEFDKLLTTKIRRFENQTYTYTRYADDMLISCPYTFRFESIIKVIEELFEELELPFEISRQKVRYASMAGRNWNLGLMYNQDQRITIGTKRKKELHSLVNSFVVEYPWDIQSTQELIGKLGYLKNVEPDYHERLFNKYETKYGVNLSEMFRNILNGTI